MRPRRLRRGTDRLKGFWRRKPALERVWAEREEKRYPALFGPDGEGIFPLGPETFAPFGEAGTPDPRWLTIGVFRFAPTPDRPTWLHVSSGLSNDWDGDGSPGLGHELVVETPWRDDDAIRLLHGLVAYDLLIAHGRFGEPRVLEVGSRVNAPFQFGERGGIAGVFVAQGRRFSAGFRTEAGQAVLLFCVGAGQDELDFARANTTADLHARLVEAGVDEVTDPERPPVV